MSKDYQKKTAGTSTTSEGAVMPDVVKAPFSAVLVVGDPDRRERLRNELLRNHVYPAVLWSLEQTVLPVGEEARSVSRRLLSVHCDGRYDAEDMTRIAKVVRQSG